MDNYRYLILNTRKYLLIIMSILIFACVNLVFVPVTRPEEITRPSSTVSQESNELSLLAIAAPADINQKPATAQSQEPNQHSLPPGVIPADVNQKPATIQSQEPNQHSSPPGAATSEGNQTPAAVQPANPSVNAVTQEAVKLGVLSCVSRINRVATFITANTRSGVFIFPVQKQPDQHIFSTSFELLRPDDSTIYASASFFPNQDAVYDTVEYVNTGCEELEKTVFKNLKRVGVVKKNIVLLDGGEVKVFLMPAGSGCVVIKKEVVQ